VKEEQERNGGEEKGMGRVELTAAYVMFDVIIPPPLYTGAKIKKTLL
jgi:hypothetical protein